MSDLIERLRRYGCNDPGCDHFCRTAHEAADEIERLRACVADEAGKSWMDACSALTKECFRHKAEIKRLRKWIRRASCHDFLRHEEDFAGRALKKLTDEAKALLAADAAGRE